MKKKHYIIFSTLVIVIPVIIWFAYYCGAVHTGVSTSILAGDLLLYTGSICAAIATIFAVVITINHNRNLIDMQFKREAQKAHDDKLFDEICKMARDIMVYLSLHDFLSSLHSELKSMGASNFTAVSRDSAFGIVNNARRALMALDKLQWYYIEILKNEDVFLYDTDDSRVVKDYFTYIYKLIQELDTKLNESSKFTGVSQYHAFFDEIDDFRVTYQYEVTEKTASLIKSIKAIFNSRLANISINTR
jgi:hypothetical protein